VWAATAPLIALMDSDDVALPERLAVQADWLEAHPDVTVCGSLAIKLLPDGRRVAMVYPETDGDIKAKLLWVDGALLNPTALFQDRFRASAPAVLRRRTFAIDHDHVFFIAMMRSGASFFSLKQPLLLYRRHAENVTNDDSGQDEAKTAVRTTLLPMFFPELTGTEGQMMLKLLRRSFSVNLREASSAIAAADKAMRETRSFYGESRAGINRILEQQVQVLLAALKRTQFRKPS
jgi:hypothetical protein